MKIVSLLFCHLATFLQQPAPTLEQMVQWLSQSLPAKAVYKSEEPGKNKVQVGVSAFSVNNCTAQLSISSDLAYPGRPELKNERSHSDYTFSLDKLDPNKILIGKADATYPYFHLILKTKSEGEASIQVRVQGYSGNQRSGRAAAEVPIPMPDQETAENFQQAFLHLINLCQVPSLTYTPEFPSERWRGLVLDQSTPKDAIAKFGQPSSEEVTSGGINWPIQDWLTTKLSDKIYRVLNWHLLKDKDATISINLTFHNNKLVIIQYSNFIKGEYKAESFLDHNKLQFLPLIPVADQRIEMPKLRDFPSLVSQPKPKTYPGDYYLVAVAPRFFISAKAIQPMAHVMGGQSAMPGMVPWWTLISRTLERKD